MLRMNPDLPAELLREYKISPAKFDIHAIMLEIHSEHDICGNCQDHLHSLISDKSPDNAIRRGFKNSLVKWGYSLHCAELQIGVRVSSRMSNKVGAEQQKECGCPDKVPRPFPTEDTAVQDLMQSKLSTKFKECSLKNKPAMPLTILNFSSVKFGEKAHLL